MELDNPRDRHVIICIDEHGIGTSNMGLGQNIKNSSYQFLIKEAYKVRDNIYLIVDTRGKVFWTDIPSKAASKYNITEETLIKLVEYLKEIIFMLV